MKTLGVIAAGLVLSLVVVPAAVAASIYVTIRNLELEDLQ